MNCKESYLTPRKRLLLCRHIMRRMRYSINNLMACNDIYDDSILNQWRRWIAPVTFGEFFDKELYLGDDGQLHMSIEGLDLVYNDDTCDELAQLYELCKTASWYKILPDDEKEKD